MASITIEIPDVLLEHLTAIAAIEDQSVEALGQRALSDYRDHRTTSEYRELAIEAGIGVDHSFIRWVELIRQRTGR